MPRHAWRIPAGLILLSLVPMLAGAIRLAELAGGPEVTPDNARFVTMPLPVVVHIVAASVFCLLGAFQFHPGLRRRRPRWHRLAGRMVAPAGILAALAGLWMAVFAELPAGDGPLLEVFRVVFGSAMVAFLVLGVLAIRRRDVVTHSAWMTRGYAIGQGAGTQAVLFIPWTLAGTVGETSRALIMGAAWVLNLAVAEWIIRRRRRPDRAVARPVRTTAVSSAAARPAAAGRPAAAHAPAPHGVPHYRAAP
ncbi:DUF2306 domain-containing protein [Cellulomonas humilata]|uniref:DUF2306 domain-containing protein n=1 Tax=Cellulomonas humilata TaxID=144055 RepID=UPI0031B5C517